MALAAADLLAGPHGPIHVGFYDGAAILLIAGVLAYLTNRFVEGTASRTQSRPRSVSQVERVVPWETTAPPDHRPRLDRCAAGVALTATSFTWREYVTVQRARGKGTGGAQSRRLPRRRALLDHVTGAKPADASDGAGGQDDVPVDQRRLHQRFRQHLDHQLHLRGPVGDRTIALAGGSHAEHWITALDELGKQHHFKVVTYLKMGCRADHGRCRW